MDNLSVQVNELPNGCYIGSVKINNLMYADDLVILAPSKSGLQSLINCCEAYGETHDIKYNSIKSVIMVFKCGLLKKVSHGTFLLNNEVIKVVSECKYLGHILDDSGSDNKDIIRQMKKVYAQGNLLLRKFGFCSYNVKIQLFRSYCTSLYTCQLWVNYSKECMRKLTVAYNNIFRFLMNEPKCCSASLMFVSRRVPSLKELLRQLVYSFVNRLTNSENRILADICKSEQFYGPKSFFCKYWYQNILCHHMLRT